MKKVATIAGEMALLALVTLQSASAVEVIITPPPQVIPGNVEISRVVGFVIQLLIVVGVLASLIFLIYGGIKWITSGGDKAAVEAARGHVVSAVIGLVIIILAFVIISFVLQLLGVSTTDIFNLKIAPLKQ